MRRWGAYAACLFLLAFGLVGVSSEAQTKKPGATQLLVESEPAGLDVYVAPRVYAGGKPILDGTIADTAHPMDVLKESNRRGQTPLLTNLEPGDYTVAVMQRIDSNAPEAANVPRGCVSAVTFSGGGLSGIASSACDTASMPSPTPQITSRGMGTSVSASMRQKHQAESDTFVSTK
jgi:hypothetical protein